MDIYPAMNRHENMNVLSEMEHHVHVLHRFSHN